MHSILKIKTGEDGIGLPPNSEDNVPMIVRSYATRTNVEADGYKQLLRHLVDD